MLNLEIKTEDGWRGLQIAQDTSIEMEHRSWLWDEESAGGFSHSFEIDIDANRELFGNSQEVHGERVRSVLEGKKMRMSVMGVPFLFGIVRLDDEIHIEDGKVDIEFCSENQEFNDLIGDMKCTDVKVKDKICVGTVADRIDYHLVLSWKGETYTEEYSIPLPTDVFSVNKYYDVSGNLINSTNVSKPYPEAAYCNMRICIQHRKKNDDGSYEETREYEVFEADRPDSGVCFYVLYFLDCLFLQLGISFDNSALRAMEDFCRLAFFTTKCEYDKEPFNPSSDVTQEELGELFRFRHRNQTINKSHEYYPVGSYIKPHVLYKIANSKNFPDEDVSSLIDSLKSAFALRLNFNRNNTSCKAVLMRDVLRDQTVVDIDALVISEEKSEEAVDGYVLKYSGSDDDTMYNYDVADSPVRIMDYDSIEAKGDNPYCKDALYDKSTGNMYRVKVDDDAEKEEELFPSLFEVGGLQEAWLGDKDSDTAQKKEIGFSPVINNTIKYTTEKSEAGNYEWTTTKQVRRNTNVAEQNIKYAVFVDKELEDATTKVINHYYTSQIRYLEPGNFRTMVYVTVNSMIGYSSRYGFTDNYIEKYEAYTKANSMIDGHTGRVGTKSKPFPAYNETPFADYDAGLALTIMRGPGNEAGIETFDSDYDGEGNAKYQTVSANYNSSIDSIDQTGNAFDYNGTAEGGVDYSGRFSLKPSAKKRMSNFMQVKDGKCTIKSRKEAQYWLDGIWQTNGVDVMDIYSVRLMKSERIHEAGWNDVDTSRELYALCPVAIVSYNKNAEHALARWAVLNASSIYGEYLTPEILQRCLNEEEIYNLNYLQRFVIREGYLLDGEIPPLNKDLFPNIIGLADVYYGLADEYTLTGLENTPDSMYYPIEAAHANRGLLETFHMEQAYFLMNKKILTRKCQMGLAELLRLLENWEHKVRIGDVVGYIYSIKYSLSMDKGVSDVEVVMWYL